MPEGVEVTLFAKSLDQYLSGKSLVSLQILGGRYTKKDPENAPEFIQSLPLKINKVSNKGKFLWFEFENNMIMTSTLGMTGGWTKRHTKHAKIKFELENNEFLYFTDVRNFGTIGFLKDSKKLQSKIKSLGRDVVNENIPDIDFISLLRKYNKSNICDVLMRQDILSGIGNYIKAEALWLSKIYPMSNLEDLDDHVLIDLKYSIKKVCELSLNNGGASIRDYFNLESDKGESTDFFNVYGKKIDSTGNTVHRDETPDKRTTHWSPDHQTIGKKDAI
jgi:formamidopyrimidine-DNA glycosylase